MSRAALDKKPHEVAAMFDGVARRYDKTNTVLSLGLDALWRRRSRQCLQPRGGQRILDLAAGTGVSTMQLIGAGADAIACDFSIGMLRAGKANRARRRVPFVAGDGMHLPFASEIFDAATISFGLRNIANAPMALREMMRVVKPGGRLVVCEFSRPVFPPFRFVYMRYLMRVLPWIATKVASNPEAYVYLAESIREWPGQQELAKIIAEAGWTDVRYRNLTGGVVALHMAERPLIPVIEEPTASASVIEEPTASASVIEEPTASASRIHP
jgi:demethylmenaquinone methyltransferase/2-methoxy-6-polyprenyl-1,4-benzoquinol methylase